MAAVRGGDLKRPCAQTPTCATPLTSCSSQVPKPSSTPSRWYAYRLSYSAAHASINRPSAQLLLAFVNRHLSPLGVTVSNVGNQFHDGVYLVMLIGSLGGFFVPPYNYHMAPTTTDMKVHNVNTAFKLMRSLEIQRNKWNAEAVVRQDVGVIIRILYALYSAFKNASV